MASTKSEDANIEIDISRNYPTNCLFREMEYDLADALGKVNYQEEELIKLQSELNYLRQNSWELRLKNFIKTKVLQRFI